MQIFNENLTLNKMEEILVGYLEQVGIIGEIPLSRNDFEYLAQKIKNYFQNGLENELYNNYRACIATFLVFAAVYCYEGNTYWPYVETYTGDLQSHQRTDLYRRFLFILKQLNLPKFEKEQDEGYKYVTPIICHSGIPQSCLDDYFEVVSDTLNNTAFFEAHIIDEFKYHMRFKVQKPVIRHFDYLDNDGEVFLQDSRELLLYYDSISSSVEEAIVRFPGLPKRFIQKCFEWHGTDKAKEKIKNRKNLILTGPKIMVDVQGMGIYALLPQQSIRECFDDSISWEITFGEKVYPSKVRLFKRGEGYVSEEKTVSLLPSDNYKICLFVEDRAVGTWEYKALADGYISFDNKGNLIRKSYLPPEVVIVVFDKNKDLGHNLNTIIEELPELPNWTNHRAYRINLKDASSLSCNFGNVEIKKDNKPFLIGGRTLFDLSDGLGASCFTQLPCIALNNTDSENVYITTMLKCEKEELRSFRQQVPNGIQTIPLKDYIENNGFGEYDITIWSPKGNLGRFYIKYVPDVEFFFDNKFSWPLGNKGYLNNEFFCRFSQGVSLEFDNASCFGNVLKNGRDYTKYVFNNVGRYIDGKLSFITNDHIYTIPVKKSMRPIMWGFMGISSDATLTWDSVPKTMSIKDLERNTDVNLIISVDDTGFDYIKLKINLFTNKQILKTRVLTVENYSRCRIPMNNFLTDMMGIGDSNFNFTLEVFSPDEEKICECLIAKIQEDIVFSDLVISIDDSVKFSWNEQGAKIDREMVLYNCYMPWEEPLVFSIENGVSQLQVNLESLVNSMYAVKIKNTDDFAFFDSEIEVPKITKMKRFVAGNIGRNLSGIKKMLANTFEAAYGDNLLDFNEEVEHFPEHYTEDIKSLCISYIFLLKNGLKNNSLKPAILKVFKRLIEYYSSDRYRILKVLLNLDLNQKDFMKLALEFGLLSMKINSDSSFSPIERDTLWKYMPELALIVDIQTKASSARLCNWIGDNVISKMVSIKKSCSFRECIDRVIKDKCACNEIIFKIDEEVMGSSKHKQNFFEYLSREYFSAKRLEKLNDNQLFRVYEQQVENTELKVFGKSYFLTVQEWITANDKDEREKIEQKLRKVYKECIDENLLAKREPLVYKILKLRWDSEQNIEFYGGMIVFANCLLRRNLLNSGRLLEQGIAYYYKKCNPLFIRDHVIFELYLTFGGAE